MCSNFLFAISKILIYNELYKFFNTFNLKEREFILHPKLNESENQHPIFWVVIIDFSFPPLGGWREGGCEHQPSILGVVVGVGAKNERRSGGANTPHGNTPTRLFPKPTPDGVGWGRRSESDTRG